MRPAKSQGPATRGRPDHPHPSTAFITCMATASQSPFLLHCMLMEAQDCVSFPHCLLQALYLTNLWMKEWVDGVPQQHKLSWLSGKPLRRQHEPLLPVENRRFSLLQRLSQRETEWLECSCLRIAASSSNSCPIFPDQGVTDYNSQASFAHPHPLPICWPWIWKNISGPSLVAAVEKKKSSPKEPTNFSIWPTEWFLLNWETFLKIKFFCLSWKIWRWGNVRTVISIEKPTELGSDCPLCCVCSFLFATTLNALGCLVPGPLL